MSDGKVKWLLSRATAQIFIIVLLTGASKGQMISNSSVPNLPSVIRLDGTISEVEWQGALVVERFFEVSPGENIPADVATLVLMGHDGKNFYLGFKCFDPDISKLRTSLRKRDEFSDIEDMVQVILDPLNTGKGGYVLQVNPSGVQLDSYYNWDLNQVDIGVDLLWYSATKIYADCWCAEIAIPFQSLQLRSGGTHEWSMDISRYRPRDNLFIYSWRARPKGEPEFSGMPVVRLEEVEDIRKVTNIPYIVVSHGEDIDGWLTSARVGMSGTVKILHDVDFAYAVNPDFSQIEADALEIDINSKFAVYYPEKRPFFLEWKELFETPIDAVFTRSINDPIVAFRGVRTGEHVTLGYVGALDRNSPIIVPLSEETISLPSTKNSWSNILRVRYEPRRRQRFGILFTDRVIDGGHNLVCGVDASIQPRNNSYVGAQWIRAWTREFVDTLLLQYHPESIVSNKTVAFDGERFHGDAFHLSFKQFSRHINFRVSHKALSPLVRMDNGFISETDFKETSAGIECNLYPSTRAVETISIGAASRYKTTYHGDHKHSGAESYLSLAFARGISLRIGMQDRSRSYRRYHFKHLRSVDLVMTGSPSHRMTITALLTRGDDVDYFASPPGIRRTYNFFLMSHIRPTGNVEVTASGGRYVLWSDNVKSPDQDMIVMNTAFSLSVSNRLNFKVVVEHSRAQAKYMSGTEKMLLVAPLISYEISPFSVFYLGSNLTYSGSAYHDQVRSYFGKIQYLFNF